MRRAVAISLFLLVFHEAFSAPRDTVLMRMNAVKLDPGCIYGVCTMDNRAASSEEALKALSSEVEDYLSASGTLFVRSISDIPAEKICIIEWNKGNRIWWTMAYVRKHDLDLLEEVKAREFDSIGKEQVERIIESVSQAREIMAIEGILKASSDKLLRFGDLGFDTPQCDVDNAFLVYYERETGDVVEIMTPQDSTGIRRNLLSGEITDTMKHIHLPIMWIIFDGMKRL